MMEMRVGPSFEGGVAEVGVVVEECVEEGRVVEAWAWVEVAETEVLVGCPPCTCCCRVNSSIPFFTSFPTALKALAVVTWSG
jgi:hypothetical protein